MTAGAKPVFRPVQRPDVFPLLDYPPRSSAPFGEAGRRRIIDRTGAQTRKPKGCGLKPKLTPHQQRKVLARLKDGETQRSIARSLQCQSGDDFTAPI